MENKQLLILSALRENARLSLTEMSKKTNIPVSTIYDKMRSYHGKVIKKHTALIDFSMLGYNTRAQVLLKVSKEERSDLQDFLFKTRNANSVFKINNGYDFMVEFIFKHIKELEDFLETLETKFDVKTQQTYYIIDDIKREEFISNPKTVGYVS
ncbi:MAG: Lrp/AsnC family transcriptional regulator [Candidatus Woesearchaeota archaeon]